MLGTLIRLVRTSALPSFLILLALTPVYDPPSLLSSEAFTAYRQLQKAAVSDLQGSSMTHVSLSDLLRCLVIVLFLQVCTAVLLVPAALLFRTVVAVGSFTFFPTARGSRLFPWLLDIVFLVLPMCVGLTYVADMDKRFTLARPAAGDPSASALFSPLAQFVLIQAACGLVLLAPLALRAFRRRSVARVAPSPSTTTSERKSFVDDYRGTVMLLTVFAILAVDFAIFPRAFAKTETFGVSLMDAGVGSVIFSMALSAAAKAASSTSARPVRPVLPWRTVGLLLLLGLARVLTVKAADYQEHVSEYGVHWNFFLTLAVVTIAGALLAPPRSPALLVGTLLAALYHAALHLDASAPLPTSRLPLGFGEPSALETSPRVLPVGGRLLAWLLTAQRGASLLAANREGVFSCVGYVALYAISLAIARFLLSPAASKGVVVRRGALLLVVAALLWLAADQLHTGGYPASRRFANLTYVVWNLALNLVVLMVFLLVSLVREWVAGSLTVSDSPAMLALGSPLLERTSRHQFTVFMLANLVTGFVNMSCRTLLVPPRQSFQLLCAYMMLLVYVVYQLQRP